jgi:hypothetical protein
VQQLYLADVLARPQGGHNQLRPVGIVQHHLDTPLGDDVELVGGLALVDDDRSRRQRPRLEMVAQLDELVGGKPGQRFGHILIDDLAVGEQDRAGDTLGQILVVRDHQDGLALGH